MKIEVKEGKSAIVSKKFGFYVFVGTHTIYNAEGVVICRTAEVIEDFADFNVAIIEEIEDIYFESFDV